MSRSSVLVFGFVWALLLFPRVSAFGQEEKSSDNEKGAPRRGRLVRMDLNGDSKDGDGSNVKPKGSAVVGDLPNLVVKLRYYEGRKVKKEISLVTSSESFSTMQDVDGKSLVFAGGVTMRQQANGRYYFVLKYSIRMDGVEARPSGIEATSGMAGLKRSSEDKIKVYSACSGSVKLLDGRSVIVYILSNLQPNSKTKLDPQISFEVSVSKWKPRPPR